MKPLPSATPPQDQALGDAAARRVKAVTSFLLDHDTLLPLLAARLGAEGTVFESAIHGNSMAPALPGRARLRVQLVSAEHCQPDDIVFYLCDDGFIVHRLVRRVPRRSSSYLLTLGDNCLVPDPPVNEKRLLGRVLAVKTETGWRVPGAARSRSIVHRLVRLGTSFVVMMALRFSVTAASALEKILRNLETSTRPRVARLLRRPAGVSLVAATKAEDQ